MNKNNLDNQKSDFWTLLQKYKIIVPMIQRDYVQGRDDVKKIRETLIKDIKKAILSNKQIELDFIYGSTDDKNNLYLLDGQQRITTLFLIYWYFGKKENKLDENTIKLLHKFSYYNRISSKKFCEELIDSDIEIKEGESIVDKIKNKTWYFAQWDNEPTIKNMLNMLECIHYNFYEVNAFDSITIEEEKPIIFYFIPLERFGLTDELYIKMNSRGKSLTDFEIFKSRFMVMLKKYGYEDLLDIFKENIDSKWTDLIWEYRDTETNLIDEQFMRYIYFITEMIYATKIEEKDSRDSAKESPFLYDNNRNPILNFELIENTYKDRENVQLLIHILNIWNNKEEIDEDFNKIFCKKYENGKVCLFKNQINLIESCLNGSKDFGLMDKEILYALILKKLQYNLIDENTKDYIRIIRNILENDRWFAKDKESYQSNLRYYKIRDQFKIFSEISKEKDIYETILKIKDETGVKNEIEKVALIKERPELKDVIYECEDLIATRGIINNLTDLIKKYPKEKVLSFIELFKKEEYYQYIYRCMLIYEDYGIKIKNGNLGLTYYYGNVNDIYSVITYVNDSDETQYKIKNAIECLFNDFTNEKETDIVEKMKSIINKGIKKFNKNEWQYYFIKYAQVWQPVKEYNATNYTFTFNQNESFQEKDDINVCYLTKRYANSWHLSLYYKIIQSKYGLKPEKCYSKDNDLGQIIINGKNINISHDGFKIIDLNGGTETIKKFDDEFDYIEQAISIIESNKQE